MNFKNLINNYKGLPREIYILFVGKIVNSIGAFVYPLMSLILTQKIGMSATQAGELVTTLAIFQVPCIVFGGKLADTIGRRKVIILFQLLGAATLILCGFINPSILTAKMMIAASCFYSLSTASYDALSADLTNKSNRKTSYSLLYMGTNIGFAVGPIIAGFLYKNYLPLIFIGDAITTLVSLLLFILFVKEPDKEQIKKETQQNHLEKETEGSVIKLLIERPILIIFPFILFLFQFTYCQWGFAVPLQMGKLYGADGAKIYGFLGAFNGLIVILATPLLTVYTKKYNALKIMATGGVLYSICFLIISMFNNISFIFLAILSLTIGEVLIAINSSTFIANNTPSSHRGRVSSFMPLISGTGYAIGPLIMGNIIDNRGIYTGWMVIISVSFLGSVLMYVLSLIRKSKVTN